jgi:hypothetical protein
MKNYVILIIILFASAAYCQKEFISETNNFKITFPSEWDVKEGNNNIVVEATKGLYIKLYVQVQKLEISDSVTIIYLPLDSLEQRIQNRYTGKYSYCTIIRSGYNTIDFVPAYYFFIKYNGETEGYNDKYISFQYQFIYKKYFYSLIATCQEKKIVKNEDEFNRIFSTFSFLKKDY